MAWTKFPSGTVRRVRHNEKRQRLDIVFRDGAMARAQGIDNNRVKEFLEIPDADKGTYFHNLIAPYCTKVRPKPTGFFAAMKVANIALAVLLLIWILFEVAQMLRLG